ncbi:helix-turn-helix transcriptional regulator [Janthinobacterium sp. 1_2014MBL_MicDiv]
MAVNRSLPSTWADDRPLVSGPQRMELKICTGRSPGAAGIIEESRHDSPLFAVHQSKENLMTTTKKFLRLPAVIEATGWSRATIWRKVKAGVLPAPIPIGPKSIAWDAEEIAQWQQRCIDARRGVA